MKRLFLSLAAAALLWLPIAAQAAIVGSSFTSVDDVSAETLVSNRGDTLFVHINGTYDMVIDIQREQGAPGSGSWATVATDISPSANGKTRFAYATTQENENLRLRVRTDTSGTAFYSIFEGHQSPASFTRQTHLNRFDDFNEQDTAQTGDTTWQWEWTTFIETDGTVMDQLAAIEEGAVDMTAGTGGTITQDVVAFSYEVIAQDAALVSDGTLQVTYRARTSSITGNVVGFCLSDTVAVNGAIALFVINSDTVADTGSTNDICLQYSSDAADTDSVGMASTNAGTVGNNAVEFSCTETLVVNTYNRYTIEIESNGDAFFFVDASLCAVEALAVATTSRLIPYVFVTSATDNTTGGALLITDYIDFYLARPLD